MAYEVSKENSKSEFELESQLGTSDFEFVNKMSQEKKPFFTQLSPSFIFSWTEVATFSADPATHLPPSHPPIQERTL